MKVIKYRKFVVLGRFFLALGFVVVGILLFFAALYSDDGIPRRVFYFFSFLMSFFIFGRVFLLMHYLLFKSPVMFSYDADKIIVKNIEINRKNIAKVELLGEVPTGFLGLKSYGFALKCKDKKTVYIPSYHVLTKKEEAEIFDTLQQYVSNHKMI
ncbi:DUF5381 family protein [Bacillus marasmi]|uniref:DUF5381 family protein n=1 Tax=Bacillus marasmi TaxID=1926279 RepID=UPI0011C89A64|nr:DUF5381 family protein [Bacillus marasmi]